MWFINSPNQGGFSSESARISPCHAIDFTEMMKHIQYNNPPTNWKVTSDFFFYFVELNTFIHW